MLFRSAGSNSNSMSSQSWTSYVTAIGGLAAVGGLASSADAGVVYYDVNPDMVKGNQWDSINFDLDQSGGAPFVGLNTSPSGADFQLRATGNENVITFVTFGGAQVAGYNILKLTAGTTIDASLGGWMSGVAYFKFNDYGYNWKDGGEGYIGLRIQNGADWNYGWARYSIDLASATSTLYEFAIETTVNQGISAGDVGSAVVPEPATATIFALALGIGGAAARRRKAVKAA